MRPNSGYATLRLAMSMDRHYREGIEHVTAPRHTRDLKHIAVGLFDAASGDVTFRDPIPPPQSFTDEPGASHAFWEWNGNGPYEHERFAVHVSGGALTIALEHRHEDESDLLFETSEPFVNHTRTVMVLRAGRATVWSAGIGDMGSRNALQRGTEVLPAFRQRLNHTLAVVGVGMALPELRKAS
jgi:hypothetical protein